MPLIECNKMLPKKDLDHIFEKAINIWDRLKGQRLFLTGGTGFFGSWLLESLAFANQRLGLNSSAVVLTRDPEKFRQALPHLANDPAIVLLAGDIKNFAFPEGPFDLIFHAATTNARETFAGESPLKKYETLAMGTKRVLDFAAQSGARRMLFTSSGVVYGSQPKDLERIPENFTGGPVPGYPQRALAEGKRTAEFLCEAIGETSEIAITIARCFSFVGPRLPLDIHYAIGNFIRDALRGGPIVVQGDGTALRAYLYAADLTIWLWTILFKGSPGGIYNVGSEDVLSIAELAQLVANCLSNPPEVHIIGKRAPDTPPDRYVPSTQKAQKELGIRTWINLECAIRRTVAFYSMTPIEGW
jgi:nucleoside-diphosphate-sugar epimerase